MYKKAKSETFSTDVEIISPAEDGGQIKETVKAKFRRLKEKQLSALEGKTNADICRAVLVQASGMLDENDQPVPWSESAFEDILEDPVATHALASKFYKLSRMGRE